MSGCGGFGGLGSGGAAVEPIKFTVTHTQLQAAALNNDIELYSAPSGTVICGAIIRHTVAFGGGAITAYSISLGLVGDLQRYTPLWNVFLAPANDLILTSDFKDTRNIAAAVSVRVAAVSVGANLNASLTGSADIWLFLTRIF